MAQARSGELVRVRGTVVGSDTVAPREDASGVLVRFSNVQVTKRDAAFPNDWVVNIVKAVGNYGEIFERNVGTGSPLKIARGINALWTKGGLQYGPPIR